jgi:hypothetical protein
MSDALTEPTVPASQATPPRIIETKDAAHKAATTNEEPLWALGIGAITGAIAFYLAALWLGASVGLAVSIAAVIVTAVRRELPEAAIFVTAAVFSTAALLTSNLAILLAALCFAMGLALSVRRRHGATAAVVAS